VLEAGVAASFSFGLTGVNGWKLWHCWYRPMDEGGGEFVVFCLFAAHQESKFQANVSSPVVNRVCAIGKSEESGWQWAKIVDKGSCLGPDL